MESFHKDPMYRVAWKSKTTGKTGHGRPIYASVIDARLAAIWAGVRNRDREYWAEQPEPEQVYQAALTAECRDTLHFCESPESQIKKS